MYQVFLRRQVINNQHYTIMDYLLPVIIMIFYILLGIMFYSNKIDKIYNNKYNNKYKRL